jgi:putative FmdB family regulatory protein
VPIYEYKCEGCGETFEVIQKFSDEPLKVHEKCGGSVHRLLSAPAFQFKGSGWYVTDYAKGSDSGSNKGGESGKTESKTSTDTAAKTDTKSETKTETKTQSKTESKPASSGDTSKNS